MRTIEYINWIIGFEKKELDQALIVETSWRFKDFRSTFSRKIHENNLRNLYRALDILKGTESEVEDGNDD